VKSILLAACAAAALSAPALAQPSPGPQPAPMPPQIAPPRDVAYPGMLKVDVDATDLDRHIFRVHETIPVTGPGPMTLLYPEWVPGGHTPRNPLYEVGGLVIHAGGQVVPWTRDPVEVFAFHLDPPPGAASLEVDFQFLSPTASDQGRMMMTPEMLRAEWIDLALYPAGYFMRRIPVAASIRLPDGWGYGTALETAAAEGGLVRFKPAPLDVVVDSPLLAGRYFRRFDLDASG